MAKQKTESKNEVDQILEKLYKKQELKAKRSVYQDQAKEAKENVKETSRQMYELEEEVDRLLIKNNSGLVQKKGRDDDDDVEED